MSVILHSRTHRKGPDNKPCAHFEASILGFHYEAEYDPFLTTNYKLHMSGRSPIAFEKVEYTIATGHNSIVTRRNTETGEVEQYRVAMYGELCKVHRLYEGWKVATYSIVKEDSGYRLSVTGKPLNTLFPSCDAEMIQEEVSHAFDVGLLKVEVREVDETWEAIEGPSKDEDEEFRSYELVEDSDWDDMNDVVPNNDGKKVACVA